MLPRGPGAGAGPGEVGDSENLAYLAEKPNPIMNSELQLVPLRSRRDPLWSDVWTLYEASFPACERWRAEAYDRAFDDRAFEADAILCGEAFAGLLFHWTCDGLHYTEHLAVSPRLRGQRIGSRALEAFCRNRRVVLEIDPPEDEVSIRRLHFYERLGFVANPYDYVHPSYRSPFHPHRLVVMSRPDPLTLDEARRFAGFIRGHVLRYSDHEHPDLPRID